MLRMPLAPMLARSERVMPTGRALAGGCVYEPKFDGYRAVVFRRGRARIQSRGRADVTTAFPDIADAVTAQVPPKTVLDGELMIWGGAALDFPALAHTVRHPARN